ATEEPHTVEGTVQYTGRNQRLHRHRLRRIEPALVDRRLHLAEVHLIQVNGEDVGEAAFRQTPMDRHLAAFEAFDAHARARLLALDAAAAGLAFTRADAAPNPLAEGAGAGAICDLIEFHGSLTPSLAFDYAHKMLHFRDHAAHLRVIRQHFLATYFVQPEADQ